MSDESQVGKVGWIDITVDDAEGVRDFYQAVVGWDCEETSMGEYSDYTMKMPSNGEAIAGVCHSRGSNTDLPSGWLVYFIVADVDASASKCKEKGGNLIVEPRELAGGRFCVVEDPSGATAALYQP